MSWVRYLEPLFIYGIQISIVVFIASAVVSIIFWRKYSKQKQELGRGQRRALVIVIVGIILCLMSICWGSITWFNNHSLSLGPSLQPTSRQICGFSKSGRFECV
jgi:uncharacterized membrane protein